MPKVFITRRIPELGISMLKEKGYELVIGDWKVPPARKHLIKILKKGKFDAMLTLLTDKVDAEMLDIAKASGVKIIANYAVGFDNIDIKSAHGKGIIVTNTPGQYSDCVAEHTVAMVLNLSTRMAEGDRFIRAGKYKGWDPMLLIGTDLSGKTLGLVGAGRIGERAAYHLVKGFGMKCLYQDIKRNEHMEQELGAEYRNTVAEILKEADVISLHVPLLPSTHHMIDAESLATMKKTAFLINTSRGPVIDEMALVKALKDGTIAGAGLDVFEFEPKLAKGLAKLPNVVLTPHIASAREGARNEMCRLAANAIIDVMEGKDPANKVTLEMCR